MLLEYDNFLGQLDELHFAIVELSEKKTAIDCLLYAFRDKAVECAELRIKLAALGYESANEITQATYDLKREE